MHAQLDVGKQRKCNRFCAFTRGLLKVPPTCEKEYKKTKAIFMLCSYFIVMYCVIFQCDWILRYRMSSPPLLQTGLYFVGDILMRALSTIVHWYPNWGRWCRMHKLSGSHFQSRVRSSLDKTSKIKGLGFFFQTAPTIFDHSVSFCKMNLPRSPLFERPLSLQTLSS